MISHRSLPNTFRIHPLSGIKGTANNIFAKQRIKLDIEKVLEYIYGQIEATKYGMLKKDLFTLVNVYNPVTQNSVGYLSQPPPEVINANTGLSITFALISRPLRKPIENPFINLLIDHTHFWGADIMHLTDYLTINIPRTLLNKISSSYQYIDDLLYYYNVIGICTKNMVQFKHELKYDFHNTMPMGLTNSKFFDRNLSESLKNVGQDSIQYISAYWENASNLFNVRHFRGKFPLYFSLYLYDRYPKVLGTDASKFVYGNNSESLHYYLSSGLRDFSQVIRGSSTTSSISDEMYAVIHLLLVTLYNEGGLGADNETDVWKFITRIRNRLKSDELLYPDFYNELSSIERIARSLINRNEDDSFIEFLEEIL